MQEHIKPQEVEPAWHALLMQVASCKNEDVMVGLDGTLKIKPDCMELFAQAVVRDCVEVVTEHVDGNTLIHKISARYGLEG